MKTQIHIIWMNKQMLHWNKIKNIHAWYTCMNVVCKHSYFIDDWTVINSRVLIAEFEQSAGKVIE